MKNTNILLTLILTLTFVFCTFHAYAQQHNPFFAPQKQEKKQLSAPSPFSSAPPQEKNAVDVQRDWTGGIYSRIMFEITILQKEIRAKLTGFARDIKKDPYGKSFWMFLAFAFMYGVVHAVGPGHGKSVVCAYFISRGGSTIAAAFMSWVITLVHVGSATIAVCAAYLFLKNGMAGFEAFNRNLQTASYGLVALIGLWLFVEAVRSLFKKDNNREKCEAKGRGSLKEIATVAFVTGIVPCPGAAIILVYTLSTGIFSAGLSAMVFLATGMAVTTSGFAFVASKARNAIDRSSFRSSVRILYSALSLLGATVITGFGLLMLSAHIS
ncbi:nickel ABC transporter permease [Maridesulfovibrio sp.]|uniref:nickel/cobalt transporter n=1 Tax=Maridesulfovibrio sp. TaxID=2795000 RepID=UPI0029F47995|nr:nickel ABC transporter permease [Maridesulfovibrio sp.]